VEVESAWDGGGEGQGADFSSVDRRGKVAFDVRDSGVLVSPVGEVHEDPAIYRYFDIRYFRFRLEASSLSPALAGPRLH
jgi:hypothetical protein